MDNLALVVEGHSALNRILPPSSVWGVTRPRDRKRKLVQRPKWIEGINRCHPLQTFGYQRVPNDDLLLRGSRGEEMDRQRFDGSSPRQCRSSRRRPEPRSFR